MNGILEQQQAIEAASDGTEVDMAGAAETIRIYFRDEHGLIIEQGDDMIHVPNAAAVDALIEALGEKRKGMK